MPTIEKIIEKRLQPVLNKYYSLLHTNVSLRHTIRSGGEQ